MRYFVIIGLLCIGLGLLGVFLLQSAGGQASLHTRRGILTAFPFTADSEQVVLDNAKSQEVSSHEIPGILVNHHLLADDLIARTFQAASNQIPDSIILISPNHFQNGSKPFITTSSDWQTSYGRARSDFVHTQSIARLPYFADEEGPFRVEHGVFNIMPFIANTYPGVPVVPIIVKDNVPIELARQTAKAISGRILPNSLVIGSFDFSHYIAEAEAIEKDRQSMSVLQSMDSASARMITVDSQPGIALFLALTAELGGRSFHPLARDSSARRLPSIAPADNTSYIVGFFSKSQL